MEYHGHSRGYKPSSTYRTWQQMKTRCYNKKARGFNRYGERGIKVCKRWRLFSAFLADMGEKPKGMSLDRINNDGNYTPKNCRWVTHKEQMRNTVSNVLLTFKGVTMCAQDWSLKLGFKRDVVCGRVRDGWSVKDALTMRRTPNRSWRVNPSKYQRSIQFIDNAAKK